MCHRTLLLRSRARPAQPLRVPSVGRQASPPHQLSLRRSPVYPLTRPESPTGPQTESPRGSRGRPPRFEGHRLKRPKGRPDRRRTTDPSTPNQTGTAPDLRGPLRAARVGAEGAHPPASAARTEPRDRRVRTGCPARPPNARRDRSHTSPSNAAGPISVSEGRPPKGAEGRPDCRRTADPPTPNQTAGAPDLRRPLTAARAGAEGATPIARGRRPSAGVRLPAPSRTPECGAPGHRPVATHAPPRRLRLSR